MSRRWAVVRKVALGVLTALVVGLVLGAASRALMRLVSLAAGEPGQFSWAGSGSIVVLYALVALPGCLLAALTRRRGRSLLLVAGALFLCVPATGVAAEEVTTASLSPAQWAGVLAAGAGIYATALALPAVALRVLDRLVGSRPVRPERRASNRHLGSVRDVLPFPRPRPADGAAVAPDPAPTHRGAGDASQPGRSGGSAAPRR